MRTPHYFRDGEYPRCELRELVGPRRWYVPDPAEATRILGDVLLEQQGIWVNWSYSGGWLVVQP